MHEQFIPVDTFIRTFQGRHHLGDIFFHDHLCTLKQRKVSSGGFLERLHHHDLEYLSFFIQIIDNGRKTCFDISIARCSPDFRFRITLQRKHLVERGPEKGIHEILFVFEMVVNQCFVDACSTGDILHAGSVIPPLGKKPFRSRQNLTPCFFAAGTGHGNSYNN